MSKGTVNKVILIGRLGADPQLRYTPTGVPCATFSIATNEAWKDDAGKEKSITDWHYIVAWRKLGEICSQYLQKGSLVFIEGKQRTRNYEKDGQKHYLTEVIADHMQMLHTGDKDHQEKTVAVPPVNSEGDFDTGSGTDENVVPF